MVYHVKFISCFDERCLRRASLRDATRTPTHTEDFTGDANGWLRLRFFISRKGSKEEESDAYGGLRLRTMEILQAIALFNEPQRRRGYRARRERTLEILQAIAFFNEPQRRREHRVRRERDRTMEILQAIAFFNEPQRRR
ncbi:MAG: hypothetical protein V7L14_01555 [Nostoc sp.]|uniref:hypothetical protein n=1 Tax=Nostoc sp. TaxID=1180 RepID=UPI002FFB8CCA